MNLGEAQRGDEKPADSMRGAKTTDQTSTRFNQDNMTIDISMKMTMGILAMACQFPNFDEPPFPSRVSA